ncbi:hypothetical protein BDZ97DRAFT_1914210 [Flammula alnicola]|nr:hypothetical protein BDZ97DRAFT_1914210 [Flammula alnicola]
MSTRTVKFAETDNKGSHFSQGGSPSTTRPETMGSNNYRPRAPAMSLPDNLLQEQQWRSGDKFHYPLPNPKENSWETCHQLVQEYDSNWVKVQTDEVQNLLIFAGLFSGVVTSFVVESYQMLQEDPEATSASLLSLISAQIGKSTLPPQPTPFSADGSVIRVNIYWFVSLSLSLITVLLGTSCMQWLREYRRFDSLSHKDSLLLRHMRSDGLTKWKVPTILSLLPTLLQSALVLFFVGLLELLWTLNRDVGIAIAIVIGLAMVFMIGTTIAPSIQYFFDQREDNGQPSGAQCPYKSPQSWACLQTEIYAILAFQQLIVIAHDWFRYDLTWNRKRRRHHQTSRIDFNHDLVGGLRWVATTFIENIEAAQAIYHCLHDLDYTTAIAAWSTIQSGNLATLDKMLHSTSFSMVKGDEDVKVMLSDQVSVSILEYFVKENPQFELALLPHHLELYTRSRCESMRLNFPSLPGLECPHLREIVEKALPDDLKVQFLLYVEKMLLMDARHPHINSSLRTLGAG